MKITKEFMIERKNQAFEFSVYTDEKFCELYLLHAENLELFLSGKEIKTSEELEEFKKITLDVYFREVEQAINA
jgi:hypothetical protein